MKQTKYAPKKYSNMHQNRPVLAKTLCSKPELLTRVIFPPTVSRLIVHSDETNSNLIQHVCNVVDDVFFPECFFNTLEQLTFSR